MVLTGLEQEPRYDVLEYILRQPGSLTRQIPLQTAKYAIGHGFWQPETYARLDERIDGLPYKSEIQAMSEEREQRLLYVGMTRAKDGLVLAIRKQGNKLKTAWLDVLKAADGKSIIKWDADADNKMLQVGDTRITIDVKEYNADDIDLPGLAADEEQYVPYWHPVSTDYPPARISPSSLSGNTGSVGFDILYDYNTRINIKGHPDMNARVVLFMLTWLLITARCPR